MSLIVACRTAREPLSNPDMKLGYSCAVCNEPLQVSPTGQLALSKGAKPFCNPCAFKFIKEVDPDEFAGTMWSETAFAQLNRMIERAKKAGSN